MKKVLALLGLCLLAGAAASPALATPITITTSGTYYGQDVGSIDTLHGYGQPRNSRPATEIAFANDLTGNSYTASDFAAFCNSSEPFACSDMLLKTNTTGVYAIHVTTTPEFFLIKAHTGSSLSETGTYACTAGKPASDDCTHFLFENLGNTSFLVFRIVDMGFGSHATSKIGQMVGFGTAAIGVPEPGTLGMFGAGIGLIGLFLGLRRRVC